MCICPAEILRRVWASGLLGGLLEHRQQSPAPRVSVSDLGWGLRVCISSKSSSDAAAAVALENAH